MSQYHIAVVVGSLRKQSFNRKFADVMMQLGPPEFIFKQVEIGDLPLYNQDDDAHPAPAVMQFKRDIAAAQGVLFITPEYNRSIPGVLKNAIDHGSRPYGQSSWAGKPAGLMGSSVGVIGSAVAQQELRNVLAYLDMPTLGQPEVFLTASEDTFDVDGKVNAKTEEFLKGWMNHYVAWVKKYAP